MVIVLGDLDDDGSGVGLNAQASISVHAGISFDKDIGDALICGVYVLRIVVIWTKRT